MKSRKSAAHRAARRAGRCRSSSATVTVSSPTCTFPLMGSSAPDLTSRLLRHERLIVGASIVLLIALSWAFLMRGAGMPDAMVAMSPPLAALALMWWLMMVAMMLPSAAPAILLYARVREMRIRDAAIARTWLFLAGYLAVWLLFSIAAAVAQKILTGPSMDLGNNRKSTRLNSSHSQ